MSIERAMKSCGVLRTPAATNTELTVFLVELPSHRCGLGTCLSTASGLESAGKASWSLRLLHGVPHSRCNSAIMRFPNRSAPVRYTSSRWRKQGRAKVTWLTSQVSNRCRAGGTQLPQGLCQAPNCSKPTPEAGDLLLWSHYYCEID